MVAAIGGTAYSHLPCVAHCIQLSILEGLKVADASPLLSKCRHIVGHFRHSAANTTVLKASHSRVREDICAPFHKLQQDMSTRWNGTYLMMMPDCWIESLTLTNNTGWSKKLRHCRVINRPNSFKRIHGVTVT